MNGSENKELAWEILEHEQKKRSPDWFWAIGIITVSTSVIAIIANNILFAVFILLGAGTLILHNLQKTERVRFEINQKGIKIKNYLYAYNQLKSFWITNNKILIKSDRFFAPILVIPLENTNENMVKEMFKDLIPEEEIIEPTSQKILEKLGL